MTALALDIGEARVGIAVSDAAGRVALPVKVLPATEVTGLARAFRLIVLDHDPDVLVCGLPRTLAGEAGPQAERIQRIARDLAARLGIELAFVDERLSSAEAKRILSAQGLSERQMRGKIDMIAASLFLQAWLDGRDREERHG